MSTRLEIITALLWRSNLARCRGDAHLAGVLARIARRLAAA